MSLDDPIVVEELAVQPSPAAAAAGLPSSFACFVTGTDTEIGKTLTSSALLHALVQRGVRACGMKPVAAGAELRDGELHNEDADSLIAAGNVTMLRSLTTPYMLKEPAAPHIAAAVEGVGGFRVPLSADYDSADLAQQLDLPVILVVGMRLGCISQALLTVEAVEARGLKVAGWVANTLEVEMRFLDENIDALIERIPAPLLGRVPRLAQPSAEAAAAYLDFTGLPNWPAQRPNN